MNIFQRIKIDLKELRRRVRSYIFCFRYLPFEQARKMPFFLESPIHIGRLRKGNIILKGEVCHKQILMCGGSIGIHSGNTTIYISDGAKLVFEGRAQICDGCSIRIDKDAIITIGDCFVANCNCFLRCSSRMTFGSNVIMGWNNELNDCDGHFIIKDEQKQPNISPIQIGDNVWIGSFVMISKGVIIANNCVVAKGAVVTKQHNKPYTLIGGVPAKDIKTGINWTRH